MWDRGKKVHTNTTSFVFFGKGNTSQEEDTVLRKVLEEDFRPLDRGVALPMEASVQPVPTKPDGHLILSRV